MKDYVLGFHFNPDGSAVTLILKSRGPAHLHGRWNGVGGKIETGEAPVQAMRREFIEEAGLAIDTWEEVGFISFEAVSEDAKATSYDGKVYLFRCFDDRQPVQQEGEKVGVWALGVLGALPVVPNLYWILPMMLDMAVTSVEVRCVS